MSLAEQIDLSAAFLERTGLAQAATLLDVTAARLAALEGENPAAPQLQPEHQEFAAPMPGPVEADHLAPGTILMLQETGETVGVVEFDGEAYLLSNGQRITDAELDQLSAGGLVSVLSPAAGEAMDDGLALSDAVDPEPEGGQGMMAEAVARMVNADLTGDTPREAAEFFDQNVQAPVLTLPDPPIMALPGKIRSIVDAEIKAWEERRGEEVHRTVMRGPDDDGWMLGLYQVGDMLINSILQCCSNEGIEASRGPTHEGWATVCFDEWTEQGDGQHAVPAKEAEPDGDELMAVAGTVFRTALYRQVHKGYTIRQHQNGTWGIYAMPPKMDFDGNLQCTALNLEDAKKKIDAWGASEPDLPREAAVGRQADGFVPPVQPRQEPHEPEPSPIPVEKEDGSQVYIRRPDGAVYRLPMVVVQRALEMGYGSDLRKLFAGAKQVEIKVAVEETTAAWPPLNLKPGDQINYTPPDGSPRVGKFVRWDPIASTAIVVGAGGRDIAIKPAWITHVNGKPWRSAAVIANPSVPAAQPAPQAGAARRKGSAAPSWFVPNPIGTATVPFAHNWWRTGTPPFIQRGATSDTPPAPDFQGGAAPEWPGGIPEHLYGDSQFEFERFATQAMISHAVRTGRTLSPREFYGNRWAEPFRNAPVAEIRAAFLARFGELGFRAVYDDPPAHEHDGEWTATLMHAKAGGISLRVRRRGGSMSLLTNDETVGGAVYKAFGALFEHEDPPPPPPRHERGVISMLCSNPHRGVFLRDVGVAGVDLERDNYEAEVVAGYDHVCADMATATPCGRLALFDGTPGCGKTYMLRAMLKNVRTAGFIIVPPTMVEALGDPSIIPALADGAWQMPNHRMVFLVEDADEALVTRDKAIEQHRSNVKALSSLLNMSDGIPGAMFDVRIVASTNAVLESIDPAILRDGRLCKRVEVKALSPDKANQVFKRLLPSLASAGSHVSASPFSEPTPLATVYKKARELGWAPPVTVTAAVLQEADTLHTAIIKKCGNKWCLYSHKGDILGHHDSYESALAQERAIKSRGGTTAA